MSKIEWTEETWNPIIGCSKVSAGCQNCYAERMAGRLAAMGKSQYPDVVNSIGGIAGNYGPKSSWNGRVAFVPSALCKPFARKKPTTYFVCSMGDLFHESVEPEWQYDILDVISQCPQHTFQILTKRPEIMRSYIQHSWLDRGNEYLPNLWVGVTVENQAAADERIPVLFDIHADVRFVSVEPMLEYIDLSLCDHGACNDFGEVSCDVSKCSSRKLDWVICGAETGPGKRLMKQAWANSLYDQCNDAGVPFFGKKNSYSEPLAVRGEIVRDMPERGGE